MSLVTVDGHETFYATGGVDLATEGLPIVLIHGAGCDHTVWALQARRLAQRGWRVFAPDLPAHGKSSGEAPRSIDAFSAWLGSFLNALGVPEPVSLVGHSMGACIALSHAAKHGSRVEKLALLGAGEAMPVNPSLLDDTLSHPQRAREFIAAFGHGRGAHFGRSSTPGVWIVGATLALLERCEADTLHADFVACNEWVASVAAQPTLIVCGKADRMTPPRTARKLAELLPNARVETIEDTGHLLLSEAPDEVSDLLIEFLAKG